MSHEFSQLSFDTVIPSAILINEKVDMKAVKLYAFIKGLTKAYGYCFATNEYLSNLMKSDVRSIQRWLIMLKKEGYLEIETEKNGIHWQRRLYVSDKFKKNLRRDMDVTPPWHGCHPPMTSVSPITKEYSNEDNNKERPLTPEGEPISSRRQSRKEELVQRADEVWTTETQHQALLKRLKGDETKVALCYTHLSDWKLGKQITGGRGDFRQITGWVIEAVEKSLSAGKLLHLGDLEKKNQQLVKDAIRVLGDKIIKGHLELCADKVIFSYPGCYEEIKFSEYGFRDRFLSRLRKMNLPVTGI